MPEGGARVWQQALEKWNSARGYSREMHFLGIGRKKARRGRAGAGNEKNSKKNKKKT
jgi:hypothetical protein